MSTLTTRAGKGTPLTNTEVDTNFTNLNTDKYQSGDSVAFAGVTFTGTLTAGIDASVSAAGSAQGDAQALTKTYNIVNTASANQGVLLPDCAAGVRVTVFNSTANTIKIYPASSEAIDDGALNASISLRPNKVKEFIGVSATQWNTINDNVEDLDNTSVTTGSISVSGETSLLGDLKLGVSGTVTAAGTTQGTATALSETVSVITTGTANQGVKLKTAVAGLKADIYNTTTADLKVYPNTSDSIDGGSADAAKILPAKTSMSLVCSNATNWEVIRPLAVYDTSGNILN